MSKTASSKRLYILLIVLALIALVVLFIGLRAKSSKTSISSDQALRLSNGQVVAVGESTKDLLRRTGSSLRSVNAGLYQYPGDVDQPVEVSINVQDDKVTGLWVSKNSLNYEYQTNAGIGTSAAQLKAKLASNLVSIDTSQDSVKRSGFKVVNGVSTTYYLTPTCGGGDKVDSLLLVLNSYKAPLGLFSKSPACLSKVGTK